VLEDRLPKLTMSDAEFRMFCDLLRKHCGLNFDANSRFLVEKRLARRLSELGFGSFASYHYHLRSAQGDEEFGRMIDLLTTNETYFLRERAQLRALIEEIVPELLASRSQWGSKHAVSIWSAGCSSGEEPYTIALMALEAGLVPGRHLRVYASDISRTMLARSRRGIYRESSLRETEPHLRAKYFSEKDGQYRLSDELKQHVDFIHLNLLDRNKIALLGSMDVILCRNVIIHDKLRPGGYLLLGHSESLINVSSSFNLCHLRHDLVYRRPVPGEETRDPWHQMAEAALDEVERGEGT
jgi:chemotaxis protein methyltransferase CheR